MTDAYLPSSTMTNQPIANATTVAGSNISEHHKNILLKRKIDLELAQNLGWRTCAEDTEMLEIPYFRENKQVNYKRRTLDKNNKKFLQKAGGDKCVYNIDVIKTLVENEALVITEGEMDCIIALQAQFKAVSVPDGAPPAKIENFDAKKYEYLKDIPPKITIILAIDDDEVGHNLLHDLSVRLGKARCKFVKYPDGCKDLNEVAYKFGIEEVWNILNNAEHIQMTGVFRMSQLPPAPQPIPYPNGINGISDKFFLRLGDFSVVTGYANNGKTTFVNELSFNMAHIHGWNIAVASFEQSPTTDHLRALRTLHNGCLQKYMSDETIKKADEFIDKHFCFIVPPDLANETKDEMLDLGWLLEKMTISVIRYNVNMIIIDPWNELEHSIPSGMTETQYIRQAIIELKSFARKYNVHIMVIAHPAKPQVYKGSVPPCTLYSISDSAHWANKADMGFVVAIDNKQTIITVAKSRYRDQCGKPDSYQMDFAFERGRFIYAPVDEE